jgi:serine O-acetyltransferase
MLSGERNENPAGMGLLALIAEDFRTHGRDPLAPGFWALAVHRFGNWRMGVRRPLRAPLTALYRIAHQGVLTLWGIDLPYNVKVGRRLRLGHHGCMRIGPREIGDDVYIWQTATIGLRRRGHPEAPIIGNRVEIGPGAAIVGSVRIGDDAVVGPKTVVGQDVAPGTVVLGVPARPIDPRILGDHRR